jgi:hypothetical protein
MLLGNIGLILLNLGKFASPFHQKIICKFSVPTLNNTWGPVTQNNWEYYELGKTQGMRQNYRVPDRLLWNKVSDFEHKTFEKRLIKEVMEVSLRVFSGL